MQTEIHEIAPGIHKLSTFVADAPPAGFGFNQYLIEADEPLLFHCGGRGLFPLVSAAAAKVVPLARLRWISFGHVESDESGSMNDGSLPRQMRRSCTAPSPAWSRSTISLTERRARLAMARCSISAANACAGSTRRMCLMRGSLGLMFEETTGTLLCGDLLTQAGPYPATTRDSIVPVAISTEEGFHATALTPNTGRTIRKLAALKPNRLAVMHGAVFEGDCASELDRLADYYDAALKAAII